MSRRAALRGRLAAGEVLVADGAIGTELLRRGLEPGRCPEALNLERPDLLEEIARRYREAGADLVQANTFGGSPLQLAAHGLAGRAAEINRAAVGAVRRAVGEGVLVVGSCGPCGRILKPYGDAGPEAVRESFRLQVAALAEAGADAVCIETMTDLAEATLAIQAAREAAPDLPVLATMTFDPTPRGYFTIMGVTVEEAARGLGEAGADAVGSNCGRGSDEIVEVARLFRRHTELPLIMQPNAGLPVTRDGRLAYPESPAFLAGRAARLIDLGVAIVGGCCGTTPEHTRALRALVDGRGKGQPHRGGGGVPPPA